MTEISDRDYRWFAARLSIAIEDTNAESKRRENKMIEVKALSDTIRDMKSIVSRASTASKRMQVSASQLNGTLTQVEDMTDQLNTANAELQGAVGLLSNGGPPLDAPAKA